MPISPKELLFKKDQKIIDAYIKAWDTELLKQGELDYLGRIIVHTVKEVRKLNHIEYEYLVALYNAAGWSVKKIDSQMEGSYFELRVLDHES
jgi:hypothetical protein